MDEVGPVCLRSWTTCTKQEHFRLHVRLLVAGKGGAKTQCHGIPGRPGVILSLQHVILAFLGPKNVYIHVVLILWTHPLPR